MILHVLIAMVAGWLQRHQQQVMTYLLTGKPRPQRPPRGPPTAPDRQRPPAPRGARLSARSHTPPKNWPRLPPPETLMRWYHRLIAQKFDGSRHRCRLGRPRVSEEIEQPVVRMAAENPRWGYRRMQGALANLGCEIDAITVRNILHRHHMDPAPRRRQTGMSWTQFLRLHWEVLVATNSFTVEVATWHRLVTYYVLVVMELSTRRVHIAGITPHPTDAFMPQCARQLTDPIDGFLLGKRYVIHDRDTKFHAFDRLLRASGVEPVVLPPRSPNRNAHCERFVRSIKEEALNQMIMIGEASLRSVIQSYLVHYHHERNHQGLGNQLIVAEPAWGSRRGSVVRRERLGGLLSYYHREAARAGQCTASTPWGRPYLCHRARGES